MVEFGSWFWCDVIWYRSSVLMVTPDWLRIANRVHTSLESRDPQSCGIHVRNRALVKLMVVYRIGRIICKNESWSCDLSKVDHMIRQQCLRAASVSDKSLGSSAAADAGESACGGANAFILRKWVRCVIYIYVCVCVFEWVCACVRVHRFNVQDYE